MGCGGGKQEDPALKAGNPETRPEEQQAGADPESSPAEQRTQEGTTSATQPLRFGTWNVLYGRAPHPAVGGSIHECPAERLVAAEIGEDEAIARRYDRIVKVLAEAPLDFLGVQELDEQLLQLIQTKTSFTAVCYSGDSRVGLLRHQSCSACVLSTREYTLGGRVMVGAVVQLHGRTVQLCCLHVNGQVRKSGPAAVKQLAADAAKLYSERESGESSWVLCADFNMGLDDQWVIEAWGTAGASVHCCGEFTVSRSDNRLDCFDGYVLFGDCPISLPERKLVGLMPKYLSPTNGKPNGDPQLRYAEQGCLLGNGQAVPAGELVLWPHGKEQPVAVLPQSSVPLGLSDHLMVVAELSV
eukprot:TRINITY_DN13174_c0_g1_i1.p1 TRINITY_DN13174_c0_g1~~TRINITY_DN13174_c0_g1_i1.p1  ORF type:complete len:356 (+),score=106.40 TRINITY_DN13174_c0_g1_i1:33-1100(+)